MTYFGKFVGLGYWAGLGLMVATVGCGGRPSDSVAGAGNASGAAGVSSSGGSDSGGAAATLVPPQGPFAVSSYFTPSMMGDGQTPGKISVDMNEHCKTRPDGARGDCYRFVYTVGDEVWGGAEWVLGGDNWGQDPGLAIPGASLHDVSFYAAEDGGSDDVSFAIGGVDGPAAAPPGMYADTLSVQVQEKLSSSWQKFEIKIPTMSDFQPPVTSLLGAFSWAVNFSTSPDLKTAPPKTIYIDDLVYE